MVLVSPVYPLRAPAFPPAASWELLHTGSFLKYELSKIISVYYFPVAQAEGWCLAWESQSLWLKSNQKKVLWHFAVLEIHWDLMWLCLNIPAAYPKPENAVYFCWCVNGLAEWGKRPKGLWTLESSIANKRHTDRRNSGNNSHLAAVVLWIGQRKNLRKVYKGISRRAKRRCGLPKRRVALLLAEYYT